MMLNKFEHPNTLQKIAAIFVLIALFAVFYPRGLITTAIISAMGLGLISSNPLSQFKAYRYHWPALFAFSLLVMFYLGTLYSPVGFKAAAGLAGKYLWLGYALLLIPIWSTQFNKVQWQNYAYYAFLLGCFSVAVSSILLFYQLPNYSYLFVDQGLVRDEVIMPFAAFLCLQLVFSLHQYRYVMLTLFALFSFEILYVSVQRTSYIVYFLLLTLFTIQRFSRCNFKQFLLSFVLIGIGILIAFQYSPKFNDGIHRLLQDAKQYHTENKYTSSGDRAIMAKYSYKIWREHPIIGAGTGSYGTEYKALNGPNVFDCSGIDICHDIGGVTHPHNEYAYIAAQLGSIGFILFVGLLISLWCYSYRLPKLQRYLLQGLVLSFAFGCTTGDLLVNDKTRYYFVTFMGLLAFSQLSDTKQPS